MTISRNEFNMWYGDQNHDATSIDKVMDALFFGGNALKDIVGSVEDLEY